VEADVWLPRAREAFREAQQWAEGASITAPFGEEEALKRYLEEQVLGRLEVRGIARPEPSLEDWERIQVAPDLWEGIRDDREAFLARLQEILAPATQSAPPVSAESAPVEGSRLYAEGLTKIYRKRKVVNEVDISVEQGEIVGLLGPNGAGKTTTFYMIVGLIPPNEGRVYLDGDELTDVPMYLRARRGVGYLAQEPSVFRKLTVEENVLAILETLPLSKADRKARLEELLNELSIAHLRDNKAYSLSGGERRRLEITRALVQEPKFMLLDEPFAGIDPIAVNDIQQIVHDLKHRHIGAIISDHNVEQTLEIVDRAYIMYEGRIRVSGTVSELVWNDEVAEIYFGPTLTARMRSRYPQPQIQPA
jgi:lipopolysaccharide export system ATP-binding protein